MFKKYFENRKQTKELKKFENSPLGIELSKHTAEYWGLPRLSSFSEEAKNKHIFEFYKIVFKIIESTDPIEPFRTSLVNIASKCSELSVISHSSVEIKNTDFLDNTRVSGELKFHISKISNVQVELREAKWKFPAISNEDLIEFVRTRSLLSKYFLNGLNILRAFIKDIDMDKDWFRPFINSSYIVEEDKIRELINLPSLLKEPLERQKYETFSDFVIQCHKNPYFEWENTWKD